MSLPARKRKEIILSIALCVIFFVISGLALHTYTKFLEQETPPVTHAAQTVQGVNIETREFIPEVTISLSNTPTAVPSQTQPQEVSGVMSESESQYTQVLRALNEYRKSKGVGPLEIDSKLQEFAQTRADFFDSKGDMDNHEGFQQLLNDNGFEKMGFNALGENSSFGEWSSAENLITKIYGSSPSHNDSQLNPDFTHVGIGIKGRSTNIVFGGKKR